MHVDDSGNVLWLGMLTGVPTANDRALYLNDTVLVQEGVTTIDGLPVETLRNFLDTLVMSDNGRAFTEEEVQKYMRYYRAMFPIQFFVQSLASETSRVLRKAAGDDSAILKFSRSVYRALR